MEQRKQAASKLHVQNELGVDPLHPMEDIVEGSIRGVSKEEEESIKQTSNYSEGDRPRINNNKFFEERSNPLSSKGD